MPPTPAGPLDVLDALTAERVSFIDLLRSLADDDWRRPTECPAYDVQGVATHVLGDDLSLLARQRDAALPGVIELIQTGVEFRTALDRFNDRWVEAARFFSPPLLIELLEATGRWTSEWYRTVDPASLGEPVGLFGATGPSPYWQITAREYVERWAHHHQIRRAIGQVDLDDPSILGPAVGALMRSLAAHLPDLDAAAGASLTFAVEGLAAWTLVRNDGDGENGDGRWALFDGEAERPAAVLRLHPRLATTVLSRGLRSAEAEAAFTVEGDIDLARRAVQVVAVIAGR